MPTATCEKADCTVGATGTCLLSHPLPAECAHYKANSGPSSSSATVEDHFASPAVALPTNSAPARTFFTGVELGFADAAEIAQARYAHLIGVLGTTGAGKTSYLTSLYLLASGALLSDGFHFAGSRTLQGFEDRARGLRDWQSGTLHSQMMNHTILVDPRQPGLLHLAIRDAERERRRYDFLLTDLPGEWTESLILRAESAKRLRFLQRADGIILIVDGPVLSSQARHVEIQRMRNFVDRLVNDVKVPLNTPIIIVVSKGDEIAMTIPQKAHELTEYVRSLGFSTELILAAAISRSPDTVANGSGVFEALKSLMNCWGMDGTLSRPLNAENAKRTFQKFRYRA